VLALQRFPQRHGIRSAARSMRSMERVERSGVALKVGDGEGDSTISCITGHIMHYWLVVWNMLLSFSWEFHHPN
jgi:hypothetical protein